jgi:tetratricopeptide (TPR) repeat protein
MDAQGAKVARPWHEIAKAKYPTLVDQKNLLGKLYNLKAIPYGVMIDEFGRLVKGPFSINVEDKNTIVLLEKWLSDATYNEVLIREAAPPQKRDDPKVLEAEARFQLGIVLLEIGKKEEAMTEWRKALELDPNNWIIHKQLWAVENPDKFYSGNVDYGWQKQQLEAEKAQK